MRYPDSVSTLLSEYTKVVGVVDGLLLIQRECLWSDGAKLGGDFMCAPDLVTWLADQLDRAADEAVSKVACDAAPDHLVVFTGGGEHGEPISINVLNRREPSASRGRTYGLSGLAPSAAHRLASDLRAWRP